VPDLYSRIKPTLLGVLPWRWGDPQARLLKPWARMVVTLWVLVVVPLLLSSLALAVIALPRLMGTAWSSLGKQQEVLSNAWGDADVVQVAARILAIIAIVIPVAGVIYLLIRLVRGSTIGAWHATAGKPVARALAVVFGGAVLCGVAYAWAPHDGNYRPIQQGERGTIGDVVYALSTERIPVSQTPRTVTAAVRPLAAGQRGVVQALWDTRTAPPTVNSPQLAVILVPRVPASSGNPGGGAVVAQPPESDAGWVFPVDKPLAPGPGDNQALAVNTTDNTVVYDTAFAMVYVDDNSDALNVNEAHAYASCNSCAAVAVAYQVVFVIDTDDTDDNVAIPQNLAASLNSDCVNCLTYAIAQQLFVTLDEPLSDEAMDQLDAVWQKVAAYQAKIQAGEVPPDEVADQLDIFTNEIKTIVEADQPGTFPTPTSTTPTTTVSTVVATSPALPTPVTSAPPPSSTAPQATSTSGPTASTNSVAPSASSTAASTPAATASPSAQPSTPPTADSATNGATSDDSGAASGATASGSTSGTTNTGGTGSTP
jgi:putative peptide zinc metalloprotease protein